MKVTAINAVLTTLLLGFSNLGISSDGAQLGDKDLTLRSLELARIIHAVYDQEPDGYWNGYHGHFAGGLNGFYDQTKPGILIIEGYYGSTPSKIHTPLGYISVGGSSSGYTDKVNDLIYGSENIKTKLISPGYQTNMGYYGPWYLVTEINGQQIVDNDFIPDFPGDPKKHYDKGDSDFESLIKPRLELLHSLHRDRDEQYEYEVANSHFDQILKSAFDKGILNDKLGIFDRAKLLTSVDEIKKVLNEYLDRTEDKYIDQFRTEMRQGDIDKVAEGLASGGDGFYSRLLSLIYTNHLNQ